MQLLIVAAGTFVRNIGIRTNKVVWHAGDDRSKATAAALEERNKIPSDNVGHRLLSKMGWKEGEVLPSSSVWAVSLYLRCACLRSRSPCGTATLNSGRRQRERLHEYCDD